jgi:hypothetical protein
MIRIHSVLILMADEAYCTTAKMQEMITEGKLSSHSEPFIWKTYLSETI